MRAIAAPGSGTSKSRKFFDDMNAWAQSEGFAGLGYATRKGGEFGGPIASNHGADGMAKLSEALGLGPDDGVFFAAGPAGTAAKLAGLARTRVGTELGLIEQGTYKFCWIVDFPMFEYDEDAKKVDFSHNPFSMPQGELHALETQDPLTILAYQYDIVCNGIELSSGAIRNHRPEIMYKAFEIAGYTKDDVDRDFAGMINAFKFGAPPHGGSAPGVDRIVMLLADEPNIREVVVFPMTQKAEDLMMNAPSPATPKQLRGTVDPAGGVGRHASDSVWYSGCGITQPEAQRASSAASISGPTSAGSRVISISMTALVRLTDDARQIAHAEHHRGAVAHPVAEPGERRADAGPRRQHGANDAAGRAADRGRQAGDELRRRQRRAAVRAPCSSAFASP